ncbi:hypothetical protein CSKR_114421 [Clonorchis sinensis]|uniref:Uncharacterized protein n=1 Tax=Clonorchis sinensis TaxID=79923 RepID=A0A8T1MFR0_CLOSI|nr:hypothetical protein CSKR_114421 [Clonorchis sinensis]
MNTGSQSNCGKMLYDLLQTLEYQPNLIQMFSVRKFDTELFLVSNIKGRRLNAKRWRNDYSQLQDGIQNVLETVKRTPVLSEDKEELIKIIKSPVMSLRGKQFNRNRRVCPTWLLSSEHPPSQFEKLIYTQTYYINSSAVYQIMLYTHGENDWINMSCSPPNVSPTFMAQVHGRSENTMAHIMYQLCTMKTATAIDELLTEALTSLGAESVLYFYTELLRF